MLFRSLPWLVLSIIAATTIYFMKNEVIKKERELAKLERNVRQENESIQVLSAEFAHLSNPKRIKTMVSDTTQLAPIKISQIISLDNVPTKDVAVNNKEIPVSLITASNER